MCLPDTPEQQANTQQQPKLAYQPPVLTVYGTIADLVQGGTGPLLDTDGVTEQGGGGGGEPPGLFS